jgi:hypothetical protein
VKGLPLTATPPTVTEYAPAESPSTIQSTGKEELTLKPVIELCIVPPKAKSATPVLFAPPHAAPVQFESGLIAAVTKAVSVRLDMSLWQVTT